jgi:hypothetical protein
VVVPPVRNTRRERKGETGAITVFLSFLQFFLFFLRDLIAVRRRLALTRIAFVHLYVLGGAVV